MADEFGEKSEAPTPRRREEAREEGNLAKSQDLTAGIMLLGAVLLLLAFAEHILSSMAVLVESMLGGRMWKNATRTEDVGAAWAMAADLSLRVLVPITLSIVVMAVVAGVVQVGFLVTYKPLTPKFSKLSPIKGVKQIVSMRGLVRLIMSLLKVAIVVGVAGVYIHLDLPKLLGLMHLEAPQLLAAAAWLIWSLMLKIALVLMLLGILDFWYQKYQHETDMKMTKQEVKEEHKRMEGDPLIKQRRAQVARQLAMQRLQHDVPKADVIVTNPTHFAIALQYDGESMAAPRVVAKGADLLAMRVRQIGAMHRIPIVERPPLARALYRTTDVGQEIPAEHYAAVAEILAYVYRVSGRKTA